MAHPLPYYRVNVAGLINVLEAMLRYSTRSIVFSSSCATMAFRPLYVTVAASRAVVVHAAWGKKAAH